MKAIWRGTVVAESSDTVVFDGEHYFAAECVDPKYLLPSNTKRMDSVKGQANFYTLFVDGDAKPDAVWCYPDPKEAAACLMGRFAFGQGVLVSE